MPFDKSNTAKSVDEELQDFISELREKFSEEEICSALELQLYAIREELDE